MTKKELVKKLSQIPDTCEVITKTGKGFFEIDKIDFDQTAQKAVIILDD